VEPQTVASAFIVPDPKPKRTCRPREQRFAVTHGSPVMVCPGRKCDKNRRRPHQGFRRWLAQIEMRPKLHPSASGCVRKFFVSAR
jgi:hypothetical protein